jgi:hypothetical protein
MKKVLLLITIMLFSGCVTIEGTAPNGLHIKYTRFMADQKMDGLVIEPDGSMLIEGQQSTLQGMTDALNAAINKIP